MDEGSIPSPRNNAKKGKGTNMKRILDVLWLVLLILLSLVSPMLMAEDEPNAGVAK